MAPTWLVFVSLEIMVVVGEMAGSMIARGGRKGRRKAGH